jgi:hypothetical protein
MACSLRLMQAALERGSRGFPQLRSYATLLLGVKLTTREQQPRIRLRCRRLSFGTSIYFQSAPGPFRKKSTTSSSEQTITIRHLTAYPATWETPNNVGPASGRMVPQNSNQVADHKVSRIPRVKSSLKAQNSDNRLEMPSRNGRILRCFYCNKRSHLRYDGRMTKWTCGNCEADNYLDKVSSWLFKKTVRLY